MARHRGPFDPPPLPIAALIIPSGSVIAGSLLTLLPMIASMPLLPPFGFMMLIAWRLARIEALPVWSPLLLGLIDDLFSGQPFGNAMVSWTVAFIVIDLLDQRLVARDFWQDWLLASGAITAYLLFGRLMATPLQAHVDTIVLVQIVVAVMLYPIVAQVISWLDRRTAAVAT